jgi:hypothetical protein
MIVNSEQVGYLCWSSLWCHHLALQFMQEYFTLSPAVSINLCAGDGGGTLYASTSRSFVVTGLRSSLLSKENNYVLALVTWLAW